MTVEDKINGESSAAASSSLTAAEKLRQKHEAEATHHPTVEDVVDEEDLTHPPPSMGNTPQPEVVIDASTDNVSAKATGKQKIPEEVPAASATANAKDFVSLDTQSEELFPALGSGPKAPATTQTPLAWGAKKPSTVHNGLNGSTGSMHLPNVASSRTSTPTSGMLTPASSAPSIRPSSRSMAVPQQMSMPGKHSERIYFAPSQILQRNQLKKPLQDTLRDINKKSKAKVEMKTGANGNVIFEGRGPVDATRQALKDLAREVGSKQQVKVPIPSSVRPHIIGRHGTVIQGIQRRTGARVQLPKMEESMLSKPYEDDDDGLTIDVSIEGDAVAAEMARREIEAIINERTSSVNLRLREIPAEYFPFIAGPHNSRIAALEDGRQVRVHVPHYHTWSDQAPPQPPSIGSTPKFVPSISNHIRISGDRLAAQDVRAEIERHVEELKRKITLSQMHIDRGRHRLILDDETSLHDFLQETGCAIILPPTHEDTEALTITGPQERIEIGMDRVMDLASAMQMSRIDIARQHAHAPLGPQAHARALTRYLKHRKAVERLEQQYSARIVLPNDGQGSLDWEVYVKEGKNCMRAKQDILNLISAHPPTRIRHVKIDPFFHQHIHQQSNQRLQNDFGVHLLPPSVVEPFDHMILIYEGPQNPNAELPRQIPSPQEIAEFNSNLEQAQEYLLSLIEGQQDIAATSVSIPPKYRDKVRKFTTSQQQNLLPQQIPVQIRFEVIDTRNGGDSFCSQSSDSVAALHQQGILQGPTESVEHLAAKIKAFVEAEEHDEQERGHVTSFDFPQKHMSHLIGRKGDNVNKFRDEYDVDIQVKEGRVNIIGPKAKADRAKTKIIALGNQMENESTHVLKIDPRYHREIIGPRGSQVNHLQERYNVHVRFPRSTQPGDDKFIADDASEVSGPKGGRKSSQEPDEVIIKGPSKGADAARSELLSLLQWTIDNSYSASVSVAQRQLPSLIGQGGQEMEAVRLTTGAHIDVPGRDATDSRGRVQIQLKGTKKQVEEARKILEAKSKAFDATTTSTIDVDRKYHKALIGSGGSNIRSIVVAAGGSDDRRDLARTVRFPRQGSEDNTIQIEGTKEVVERIVASIKDFVSQKEGQITEFLEVPPEKHRLLIGRGGESRRNMESQFEVELNVPRFTDDAQARSQVKISGQPANIERVKAHILELIQDLPSETIQVPRKYHHHVADNGQFFRRLRNDYKVTVDHGNHSLPQKPDSEARPQSFLDESLPLITDTPGSSTAHSFSLIDSVPISTEEGTIPWILKGSPDNIAKARSSLEKALKAAIAQEIQSTGYLVLPDPRLYRFVIGHGGSKINEIRRQTGCKINVPRSQKEGSAIEIVGSKEGVEQARDIILDTVGLHRPKS